MLMDATILEGQYCIPKKGRTSPTVRNICFEQFLDSLCCHVQLFIPCIQISDDQGSKGVMVISADLKIQQVVVI